jgi:hypothetical protein
MSQKHLNTAAIQNELAHSVYFARPAPPAEAAPKAKPSISVSAKKTRWTAEVPQSRTAVVPKSGSYELRKYDQFRRLDVRLTREQLRFLQEMEEDIRERMPEVERSNPEQRRITKSAIARVMVELFRQFDLKVNATRFRNEHDLMRELHQQLINRLRELSGSRG